MHVIANARFLALGECDDVNQTKAVNEGEEVSKSLYVAHPDGFFSD